MSALASAAGAAPGRVARLRELGVLDATAPHAALADLVRRAQDVARFPIAWISFLDASRERLHAVRGVTLRELAAARIARLRAAGPRAAAASWRTRCARRGASQRLVAGAPHARFIAMLPLACADGMVVGTLTVLDRKPRALAPAQQTALANLAALAMARLEARRDGAAATGQPVPQAQAAAAARRRAAPGRRLPSSLIADPHQIAERLEAEKLRRRAAEEELEREKGLLEAVLDSLASAFFLVVVGRRDAALEREPRRRAGLQRRRDRAHAPARTSSRSTTGASVEAALREVLEEGREIALEAEIVDRAGNVRPYALTGRPAHPRQRSAT